MKLRYLRARNLLSFGDEDIKLEFGPFNVIAGPNDSGKTNLFRALSLIEKAFDYGKLVLDDIIFQGESDRSLHLEVCVELDDTELELLATLIICFEIASVQQPQDITQEIKENKLWKSILTNYGYHILSKSLRRLSFVITKDELTTSEPKIVLEIADDARHIFMNRSGYLSETSEDVSSYQHVSLTRLILDDFNTRFKNTEDNEINALLQNEEILAKESPSLVALLSGKLGGDPTKMIELRGGTLNQLRNSLRGEPLLAKLYHLCRQRKIEQEDLYLWNVLQRMYRNSFVRLQELRIFDPSLESSRTRQGSKVVTVLGNDLALRLFWLMNSGTRRDREKYNKIQGELKNLTGSEFDVAVRTKEVTELSKGELGVMLQHGSESMYPSGTEFAPLGIGKENRKRLVNEAYVQVIKDNYPIPIEQTASGLYEILFMLTTIIGESGKVLLLDEPELHLHPTMQKRILNLFSQSMDQERNQIVLITHSPYLVSTEDIDATWRFTRTESGTKIHNLGRVLSELERQEQKKLAIKLSKPDIRSLLFSQGVIFVEGPSDKIVVEQIDRHLSTKNEGSHIDENEWSVIDIGGKKSLHPFMTLTRMLGVPNVAIMDYDALMHREHTIKLKDRKMKTSLILFALWCTNNLNKCLNHKALSPEMPDSEWYENSLLADLRNLSSEQGIFVFSTDLEGVMRSPKTTKKRKPLKALERILELINQDNIPSEFYDMCKFLRKYTSP